MSADATLGVTLEPLDEPARLPTGSWVQDQPGLHPQPLWVERASEVAARLSLENLSGLYALAIDDPTSARVRTLLELSGWGGATQFHVGLVESTHPIEEGFLRRLRFWRSKTTPAQSVALPEVLRRFVDSETARINEPEAWLRSRLGLERPPGRIYELIDYPHFDCGSGELGFATLVHGPELHVWSRFVHHHK